MTEWLHFHFSLSCIGEGNGNPLQCSCLENPRDWGAWWAAVYGGWTWLKQLSSGSNELFFYSWVIMVIYNFLKNILILAFNFIWLNNMFLCNFIMFVLCLLIYKKYYLSIFCSCFPLFHSFFFMAWKKLICQFYSSF